MFGRRAALEGLDEPPTETPKPSPPTIEPPSRETREAVWRHAGLERDRRGPHELARTPTRSPASSPPARSRARRPAAPTPARSSPTPDPALDRHHTVLDPDAETPRFEAWTGS